MVISFHHAFREGDKVLNQVVATLAKLGFRNLTLASSSLLNCHDPLVEHIKSGVITQIYSSGLQRQAGRGDFERVDADSRRRFTRTVGAFI